MEQITELSTSHFEIAQLHFALEQTFILGAMALNKKQSKEQTDKIQILSGLLIAISEKKSPIRLFKD